MLLLILFFILSLAEFTWVEEVDNLTLTVYHRDIIGADNYVRTGYTYTHATTGDGSETNTFLLLEEFAYSKFVISNTIPHETETLENGTFVINFNSNTPNLKAIQFMNYHSNSDILFFTNGLESKIQLLLGCFGSQTGCVTEYGWGWSAIYLRGAPMSIITDDINHNIAIYYMEIYDDPFSYTYLFIDGISTQTILILFGDFTNQELFEYSTIYYLFTVPSKHYDFAFQNKTLGTLPEFICESKVTAVLTEHIQSRKIALRIQENNEE
ncbi:hypothetical protein QTN25_005899 [Entamoeba marina]